MPEPAQKAVQGEQDAKNATTPQQAATDKPTTTTEQSESKSEFKGVMDLLDIPAEVQSQVEPKAEEPKAEPEKPAEKQPDEIAEPETEPEEKPEVEETDTEEEDEPEKPAAEAEPQKLDKRQKRINRLTRQRNEALDKIDALERQLADAQGQKKEGKPSTLIPSASPRLAHIADEAQLNRELAKAEAVMDWCDENPEGKGLSPNSIDPEYKQQYDDGELTQQEAFQKTVAKWRRESEKLVIGAPNRREELRAYRAGRDHFDGLAREYWPELFDKGSEEHQLGQALLSQFPAIKAGPNANYAIGLVIEGAKALQERIDQGKNGQRGRTQHRDISERVFEPRVPLAPHTAEPPSREATPSPQKRLNEAMSDLVRDVDGGADSLAQAFSALDQVQQTRATSRTRVSR